MNCPLKYRIIVNTRPAHQSASLTASLREKGGQVIEFPCLQILPVANSDALQRAFTRVDYDYIVFVSANAARCFAPYWQTCSARLLAVGPATAVQVATFADPPRIPDHYSSQGLLQLPELTACRGKRILIIMGNRSKGELQATLEKRGARVSCAVSYTVEPANIQPQLALGNLQAVAADTLIVTSLYALQQLTGWFLSLDAPWLTTRRLVVVSDQMQQHAVSCGWSAELIIMAKNATRAAIVAALQECA